MTGNLWGDGDGPIDESARWERWIVGVSEGRGGRVFVGLGGVLCEFVAPEEVVIVVNVTSIWDDLCD